jgi:hypothetical protein
MNEHGGIAQADQVEPVCRNNWQRAGAAAWSNSSVTSEALAQPSGQGESDRAVRAVNEDHAKPVDAPDFRTITFRYPPAGHLSA